MKFFKIWLLETSPLIAGLIIALGIAGAGSEAAFGQVADANAIGRGSGGGALDGVTAGALPTSDMKVSFDEKAEGVVFIESNGKKFRIDSKNRSVELIEDPEDLESRVDSKVLGANKNAAEMDSTTADIESSEQDQDIDEYYFEPGYEPFDYRIVNVPTPKSVPKGTWNISFSHRFSQPIHPVSSSGRNLLGFDGFSVSSFNVAYGITDKIYVSAGRNPICRRGLCRTIELGVGYHWLDQNDKNPIALSTFASVEGNGNFTEQYTMNAQAMVSRRIGKRVYLFFSPALHLYSNGGRRFDPRPEDFFPPATVAETFRLPKHSASFGFGTTVMITPSLLGLFEFVPRTGFKLGRLRPVFDANFNVVDFENLSEPSIGIGIQKNIGNHSFALTLSNTQTTTTSKYNSSNLVFPPRRLVIGFNLFRRF